MDEVEKLVYKYLVSYIKENGYPPTLREIADHCYLTLNATYFVMHGLESEGWIEMKAKSPRAIKVCGYQFVKVRT